MKFESLKIDSKLSSVGLGGNSAEVERSGPVFSDVLISQ